MENEQSKKKWAAAILIIIVVVAAYAYLYAPRPGSAITSQNKAGSQQWSPRVYTNDIVMTTETTNVSTPFGYHLNVNWGYAPIHVVQGDLQVTGTSPGHTEYSIGQGLTFEFNQGYRVVPVKLHCTYTELKPGEY